MVRIRLDKMISHMGLGTRKEMKLLIKRREVQVNGEVVRDSGLQIETEKDVVTIAGEEIQYQEYFYIMLNKPPGVVSATKDSRDNTVIDLLDEMYQRVGLFPVGRLDKDTEGLLLLTNNGKLSHQLLAPKKHVAKTYYAQIEGIVTEEDVLAFSNGVQLEDGYKTLPSQLTILKSGQNSEIEVTIYEGKFHQVKRMFQSVQKEVVYLKRLSMGELVLDPDLELGEYRELTEAEMELLPLE